MTSVPSFSAIKELSLSQYKSVVNAEKKFVGGLGHTTDIHQIKVHCKWKSWTNWLWPHGKYWVPVDTSNFALLCFSLQFTCV